MNSLFVSGTDTDVGKTFVTAGLAATFRDMGIDVGVMKPYAAGDAQKRGFMSKDVEILVNAAKADDPEHLVNPQFFPIPASPYTAWKNLKIKPKVGSVLSSYRKLSKLHPVVLVEGMGGIMTPILREYCVADLISGMGLPAVLVTTTKIGTINHTIMTVKMCQMKKIPVKGIIINNFDPDGYEANELARDLKALTKVPLAGTIPFIDDVFDVDSLCDVFKKNLNLKLLA